MKTGWMSATKRQTGHPLDPLTGDQIETAAALARSELGLGPSARFITITALEPSKESLRNSTDSFDRAAEVVVIDPERRRAHELRLSLRDGAVVQHTELIDDQPAMVSEEYILAE